jgi:hypothetical protein
MDLTVTLCKDEAKEMNFTFRKKNQHPLRGLNEGFNGTLSANILLYDFINAIEHSLQRKP